MAVRALFALLVLCAPLLAQARFTPGRPLHASARRTVPVRPAAPPAGAIATRLGRVVDVCGDAVPAAVVRVVSGSGMRARTVADAQGIYMLRWRPLPGDQLSVTAPGKCEERQPVGSGTAVVNVTLEDGSRLHGNVTTADGAPVAGAAVLFVAGLCSGETRTDGEGAYEFGQVPFRSAIVRVFAPGGVVERTVAVTADQRCDFVVERAQSPEGGRIVRVRGLPVDATATAYVEVMSSDLALQVHRGRVPLRADGTAMLHPTDTSIVSIVAEGYATEPRGRLIDPGHDGPLEFAAVRRLLPAEMAVMSGRVLDARERPVAGVVVAVADAHGCELVRSTSAADGGYVVRVPLPRDTFCRIGVELRDHLLQAESVRIARGFCWLDTVACTTAQFDLRVARAAGFRSELRGRDGERFAFADVVVAPAEDPHVPFVTVAADQQGCVEVRGLPPGDYVLTATSHQGEIVCGTLRAIGGDLETVTWRPVPSGYLRGRLLDAEARPLPGVLLLFASPQLREGAGEPVEGRLTYRLRTDRNGRFGCRGLPTGEWTVAAVHDPTVEGGFFDVVIGQTTDLELRQRPAAR